MALFVLIGIDKPGAAALRAANRPDHLAYLESRARMVKLGGPFLDEAGQPAGSMVIIEAEDIAAAEAFQREDPYAKAALFQSTELRPWRITVGGLG